MTIMEAEQTRPAAITRPASGIELEPGRLTQWMNLRVMSRQDVSDRIAELRLLPFRHLAAPADGHKAVALPPPAAWDSCAVCGAEIASLSRDAIAKIANGTRKPKARTLKALCTVLECPYEALLPGSYAPDPDTEARRRIADFNQGMRDFADALNRPELYRRPDGRIRYTAELRRLYAQFLADTQTGTVADAAALLAS